VDDLEIVWEGNVVGWLKNVDFETFFVGSSKIEGDFLSADGPIAAEFRTKLQAHGRRLKSEQETSLAFSTAERGGRAKLWSPTANWPWEVTLPSFHTEALPVRPEIQRALEEVEGRDPEERRKKKFEVALRQFDGLIANTERSVQALEDALTADEQHGILEAIEKAKKAKGTGNLDDLRFRLQDMEKAATVIGDAIVRR
jgi:hypothetical protein